MIAVRLAKLLMVACLAVFALLVAFDNVIDYDANYEFVRHVLSMDTTFPGNALRWRAITSPALWQLGYAVIIAGEALTGAAFAAGAVVMARHLRGDAAAFARARGFVFAGATLAFLVWFLGFMVVGGEWFAMWQSPTWNGQQAAFRFYVTALLVLLVVAVPEDGPPR